MARRASRTPKAAPQAAAESLPPLERLTDAELGFTTTRSRRETIKLAARISGKKVATYLRDIVEADAICRVAEWQRQRMAS